MEARVEMGLVIPRDRTSDFCEDDSTWVTDDAVAIIYNCNNDYQYVDIMYPV
jgi:hypothetical protein